MDQEATRKAYELGAEYERTYRGCGQCIVAAVQDALDVQNPEVFKAASALAGGVALAGDGCCGAYLGGAMMLGSLRGRERHDFADAAGVRRESIRLARRLHDRFIAEYGSVICRDIHTKTLGRPYYLADADEMAKFDAAGGHSEKCPEVVGKAARWVTEIVLDEGLLAKST